MEPIIFVGLAFCSGVFSLLCFAGFSGVFLYAAHQTYTAIRDQEVDTAFVLGMASMYCYSGAFLAFGFTAAGLCMVTLRFVDMVR